MTELAARLLAVRKERGLTQQQLADLAGVHQGTVASIESGRTADPAASVLLGVAKALDVDPRDLLPLR